MRIVVVADAFGPGLAGPAAAAAIVAGWRAAAPEDQLTVLGGAADLGPVLAHAELVVVGGASLDWSTLRDSVFTAVAGAALERGVPCVVLAGAVGVGRREAAAIGVDAAYAVDDPPGPAPGTPACALAALAERVARRWSRGPGSGGA